MKAVVHIFV